MCLINYNISRYDRSTLSSNCSLVDGILISGRKDIYSFSISVSQLNVEQDFVTFTLSSQKYIVGVVYIHPCSPFAIYEMHVTFIESIIDLYPDHSYIFCGDYNLPKISWSNDADVLTYFYSSSSNDAYIPESLAPNRFFQINTVLNNYGSLLDLAFCNNSYMSISCSV